MIAWEWLVPAVVSGIAAGWSAKSASLIGRVKIEEVRKDGAVDHYLVRLGTRLVYRTRALRVARRQQARLIATLRGRRRP